jgi:hypothetical protein
MIYASTPATASADHKGPGVYLATGVGYGRVHEPNPVLLGYREHVARRGTSTADEWLSALAAYDAFGGYDLWDHRKNVYHSLTTATEWQIEHARRVIEKLAVLEPTEQERA